MALHGKKSVYIDTNELVYARASENFPKVPGHTKLKYYKDGRDCVKVLNSCTARGIVVFSSIITQIEMQVLHIDWAKKKRLVDLNLPLGFVFGESRSDDRFFVDTLFTKTERASMFNEINVWLKNWNFNTLIQWKPPQEIPFWGELTTITLQYVQRGQLADALHIGASIGLQCTCFFTNDSNLRKVLSRMQQDVKLRRELEQRKFIDKGYRLPDAITDVNGLPR
jgi:hypothetical protein